MNKQTIIFAVAGNQKKELVSVGRSTIAQPQTNFKGGSIKWFDDSRLLKKHG